MKTPKPKRQPGRPAVLDNARSRSVYLTDADWAALAAMGYPNRSHAIAALIRERENKPRS